MPRPMPERRDPPVGWVRLRFTKLGPARFMSARDVARLMERVLKRAGVPVAYSSGFSPHQRVSYAFPAPTGAASHAEYALVALAATMAAEEVARRLGDVLPDGVGVWASATGERHLASQLTASRWSLTWPDPALLDDLAAAASSFLAAGVVPVERHAKSGSSRQDVRAAVVSLSSGEGPAVTMVLRQGDPLIRPTDVAAGLATFRPALSGAGSLLPVRLAQGSLTPEGAVIDLP